MTGDGNPSRDAVRSRQLMMTKQTWLRLQSHGVDSQTELRLDFFYNAPTRLAATELQGYLQTETDYETRVVIARDIWRLEGRTQLECVDEEILLGWVDWMVAAGFEFNVVFDGWGTAIGRAK